mmetsp:Transcript_89167/g.195401  ORF Transcript_89167/g.195401 Transcript_89167/m.195401 type:complete len:273 (-) Transcript_89167:454-1272(-)
MNHVVGRTKPDLGKPQYQRIHLGDRELGWSHDHSCLVTMMWMLPRLCVAHTTAFLGEAKAPLTSVNFDAGVEHSTDQDLVVHGPNSIDLFHKVLVADVVDVREDSILRQAVNIQGLVGSRPRTQQPSDPPRGCSCGGSVCLLSSQSVSSGFLPALLPLVGTIVVLVVGAKRVGAKHGCYGCSCLSFGALFDASWLLPQSSGRHGCTAAFAGVCLGLTNRRDSCRRMGREIRETVDEASRWGSYSCEHRSHRLVLLRCRRSSLSTRISAAATG